MALCPTTQSFDNASEHSQMPHGKARRKLPSPRATHEENIPEGRNDLANFFSQLFYFCRISEVCSPMATPMQLDGTLFRCEKKIALIGLNLGTD